MIQSGIARSAELPIGSTFRRLVGAVASLAVIGSALILAAPAPAQVSGMSSSGSSMSMQKMNRSDKMKKSDKMMKPAKGGSKMMAKGGKMMPALSVLVFPTDGKGGVSDQISDAVTDAIQTRLNATGNYRTIYFLRSIPTVKRALNEAALTTAEVSHPYDDDAKLRKIMPLTGYDMALTTSVDSYTYDDKKNEVTVLISARLIDYRGAKPIVRAAAENGSSPANAGNAREIVLASAVARQLADKLINTLLDTAK